MFVLSLAEAVGEGIISLPKDIFLGVDRTIRDIGLEGYAQARQDWGEDARLYRALKRLVIFGYHHFHTVSKTIKFTYDNLNPITEAVNIIVSSYLDTLPPCAIKAYAKKIGVALSEKVALTAAKKAGAYLPNFMLKNLKERLANKITENIIVRFVELAVFKEIIKKLTKFGISSIIFIITTQGMVEEAARASHRLRSKHPLIYKLFRKKDLDMIYFLIEKPMEETYLKAIQAAQHSPDLYKQKVKEKVCNDSLSD